MKKLTRKTKTIIFSAVIIAMIVFFCTPVGMVVILNFLDRNRYNADYDNYKDEFNRVKDFIYEVRSDEEGFFI